MDFGYDARTLDLRKQLLTFMDERIYPAEAVYAEQVEAAAAMGRQWERVPVTADLKAEALNRGLWNLFLTGKSAQAVGQFAPDLLPDPPLTNVQYAALAEITGWSPALAPEALNCAAPDTGNMEVLAEFGTPQQQEQWLRPLLEGRIRSAFCMTEPDVASSDATNIATTITPRRRRVRDQRPQVVVERRDELGLQDLHRDGRERRGRARANGATAATPRSWCPGTRRASRSSAA